MPRKDPQARAAYQAEYREKNRKRRRAACAKWYKENRESQKQKFKEYYQNHRERLIAYAREYAKTHHVQVAEGRKRYYKRVSASLRNKRFMDNYGITSARRDQMLKDQESRCAICGTHAEECPKKELYVDHCHTTGKVRQLLCTHCNTALGHFRDNVFTLHAAIAYLEKHHPEKKMDQ